ncbi:MAG TPA: hypothetical protein VMY16_09345 [Ilumatobacteraceae bacterium]|nr:hypothetical protein [Ilumatobacteraceae bacterium]
MRPSVAIVVLIAASLGVLGCEAIDEAADPPAGSAQGRVAGAPAADSVSVPMEQVGSCVEQIKFGAYTGDAVWGEGTVADGLRWLAHEYVHHQLDVEARAR